MNYCVEEWVKTYEQERGREPSELVIQVARHIEKVGEMLKKRGSEDAQLGEKAVSLETFRALVRMAFRINPEKEDETVEVIADVWRLYYMDGYEARGEVEKTEVPA